MNMSHHSEYLTVRMSEKTIDNGLYLLIIYFSWFAVFLSLWYMGKVIKMMINAFGDNRNFRVQLYLFTPVSLFFTGSIFSPEYAFLIVCPFILRKSVKYYEVRIRTCCLA
ncbi:colanic acid biosynthesis protein [Escherichia coli]|uniref:Colanic acid biosynthesis protein n=1 Tax=Escherichia coli TaxID=562 RepID=A0A376KTF0_ECOLX|nr:colanic acid biosynthesis protein [Escherichia coli]